jgi:hypothetical protein
MSPMLSERFEMRFNPELVEKIDQWRNAQPVPPSRAAAIRYLLEKALETQPIGQRAAQTRKPRSTGKSASKRQ